MEGRSGSSCSGQCRCAAGRQWGWRPAAGTTTVAFCFLGAAEDDCPVDVGRCRAHLVAGACGNGPALCTGWRVVSCREVVGEDPSAKASLAAWGENCPPGGEHSRRKQTHLLQLQPQTPKLPFSCYGQAGHPPRHRVTGASWAARTGGW